MSFNQPYTFQTQFQQQQRPQQQQQQQQPQGFPNQGMNQPPNPYSGVQLQQQQQATGQGPSPVGQQLPPQQQQIPMGYRRPNATATGNTGATGSPYAYNQGNQKYPAQAMPKSYGQLNAGGSPAAGGGGPNSHYLQQQLQAQQQQNQQHRLQAQQQQRLVNQRPINMPPQQQQQAPLPVAAAASPQVVNSAGPVAQAATSQAAPAEFSGADQVLKALEKLDPPTNISEKRLEQYLKKDAEYEKTLKKQDHRKADLLHKKQVELDYYAQSRMYRGQNIGLIFGEGYQGYGNGWTGKNAILQYPRDRKRAKRRARELIIPTHLQEYTAETPEVLCPIRLDFESDKFRLRDTFTWNTTEKALDVGLFVENLLEDFGMSQTYAESIKTSIKEQLDDFHPHMYSDVQPNSDSKDEDMRINIKLDITIGQHNLVDQFEWDMNCPDNNPEQFAEQMCKELSLSGEFVTAIAHAIREQTQLHTKSLFLTGHPFDGSVIEEDDIRREMCSTVSADNIVRQKHNIKDFTPVLFEIPEVELDRQDKDRDRDSRRKRRQGRAGRRGGPVLPDLRELVRTFRTPVYSAILPGGIDKNLELLRKYAAANDNSDDEYEDDGSVVFGSGSGRGRGRRAAHAAQAAIHGQIQYNNNPHSTIKYGTPGRPALHKLALQNNAAQFNSSSNATPQSMGGTPQAIGGGASLAGSPLHSRSRSTSSPSPEEYGSVMVTLKVPRLRNIMAHNGYT